jgi:hypothetical protein
MPRKSPEPESGWHAAGAAAAGAAAVAAAGGADLGADPAGCPLAPVRQITAARAAKRAHVFLIVDSPFKEGLAQARPNTIIANYDAN